MPNRNIVVIGRSPRFLNIVAFTKLALEAWKQSTCTKLSRRSMKFDSPVDGPREATRDKPSIAAGRTAWIPALPPLMAIAPYFITLLQ